MLLSLEVSIDRTGTSSQKRALFVASLLVLLVLALVLRLAQTQLQTMAYMPYAVLAAGLFGLALGLASGAKREPARELDSCLINLLILSGLLCLYRFTPLGELALFRDIDAYLGSLLVLMPYPLHELLASTAVAALLHLTLRSFYYGGRALSPLISDRPAIEVYLIALAAGLVTVLLAGAAASLGFPPAVWAAAIFVVAWLAFKPGPRRLALAVFIVVMAVAQSLPRPALVSMAAAGSVPAQIWGCNHEIATIPLRTTTGDRGFAVFSNGSLDQIAIDPSMSNSDWRDIQYACGKLDLPDGMPAFYQIPYSICPHPREVLILGSGTGNDVAAALAHGASHVDAVEIDPAILQLGRLHPSKPYSDPRVSTYCEDGRKLLMTRSKEYDLIVVGRVEGGLPVTVFSDTRPGDYLLTIEALKLIRERLTDQGYLALSLGNVPNWLAMRLANNVVKSFEMSDGGVLTTAGFYLFTSRAHPRDLRQVLSRTPWLVHVPDTIELNMNSLDQKTTIDDFPFLFAAYRTMPLSYVWCLYLLIAVMLLNLSALQKSLRQADGKLDPGDCGIEREFVRSAAWGAVATLSVSCIVMTLTKFFGGTNFVIGLCLTVVAILGALAGLLILRFDNMVFRYMHWALPLTLILAFFFMPRSAQMDSETLTSAVVYGMLPVLAVAFSLAYSLKHSRRPLHTQALQVGGGAVGLSLVNACLLTGVCNLWLLAFVIVVAAELLSWRAIDDTAIGGKSIQEASGST